MGTDKTDFKKPTHQINTDVPATKAAVIGAYAVHPQSGRNQPKVTQSVRPRSNANRLEEAVSLTKAIGLDVVMAEAFDLKEVKPATYVGTGRLETLRQRIPAENIEVVIFDVTLSPTQQRNLERDLNAKVLDRTGLILEIFGERAQTREGQLQVDYAHLMYQKSRLVRSWTHLERQRGSLGFIGGPGETQIEADRRQLQERIARIEKELETVRRTRGLHRSRRKRTQTPVVALVGYTNAGKSTLFNRISGAGVLAKDLLFATLDPTARQVDLPNGTRVILTDTVGFISNLPTHLVAAFRATLEEVVEADVIVHVHDASDPDAQNQTADVNSVLAQLGIDAEEDARILEVWNKVDLVSPDDRAALSASEAGADGTPPILVSAVTGEGMDALTAAIEAAASRRSRQARISLSPTEGAALNWLYERGQVQSRDDAADGTITLDLVLPIDRLEQFQKKFRTDGGAIEIELSG